MSSCAIRRVPVVYTRDVLRHVTPVVVSPYGTLKTNSSYQPCSPTSQGQMETSPPPAHHKVQWASLGTRSASPLDSSDQRARCPCGQRARAPRRAHILGYGLGDYHTDYRVFSPEKYHFDGVSSDEIQRMWQLNGRLIAQIGQLFTYPKSAIAAVTAAAGVITLALFFGGRLRFVHVIGTHTALERGLRFPKQKPH